MNILVANNHLVKTGGTENYTFAIIIELVRLGYNVEYYTNVKGPISEKIEQHGVRFRSRKIYDLIIANHTTMIESLYKRGFIIQTCNGVFIDVEQPSSMADFHISISDEIFYHLKKNGYYSKIIYNGIDCERFYPKRKINHELTTVLSLCQSEKANMFIESCCEELNVRFMKADKFIDNVWNLEDLINQADLVVGIGRSLYDSMACGRCVISFDSRDYSHSFGDGYLTSENISESIKYNCTGRGTKKTFTKEQFICELQKYNPSDGYFFRNYALTYLNIKNVVQDYIGIKTKSELRYIKIKKIMLLVYKYMRNRIAQLQCK